MKSLLTVLTATLLSTQVFAATKVCFGLGDEKGNNFKIELTEQNANILGGVGNVDWLSGQSPRIRDVRTRNGSTLVVYDLGTNDGTNHLLVQPQLLQPGTTGYAKMRNRGESYYQSTYFCRDAR